MGIWQDLYKEENLSPLLTDKYHLTTLYGYWKEGRANNEAIFYMFGRKEALNGGYTVAAGLEGVIDVVQTWQKNGYTKNDIAYIKSLNQFPDDFINYLKTIKFTFQMDAAPEGTVFFPQEPILRVKGPIGFEKALESVGLGICNGQSGYITQATRMAHAVNEELENGSPRGAASVQGMRRGPGLGAMIESSRALIMGGYTTTSTGTAAMVTGQVFAGTMDHAWIMTHKNEVGQASLKEFFDLAAEGKITELRELMIKDAFRAYAFCFPERGILLVDTYASEKGTDHAVTVMKELKELRELGYGDNFGKDYGVRYDSGDLVSSSQYALRKFAEADLLVGVDSKQAANMSDKQLLKAASKTPIDEKGINSAFVAGSDSIDEYTASEYRRAGAYVRSWGIGTAGAHITPIGLVMKASAMYMEQMAESNLTKEQIDAGLSPVMKVASSAPAKSSNPGMINSRRYYNAENKLCAIVIYDELLGLDPDRKSVNLNNFVEVPGHWNMKDMKFQDILVPVFNAKGEYIYNEPEKVETFKGSGKFVTDGYKIVEYVNSQLDTLYNYCKIIVRPEKEILSGLLLKAFKEAEKNGGELTINVDDIKAQLPKQASHMQIYLDNNLFQQRIKCEKAHTDKASTGVKEYHERYEGGAEYEISGNFKLTTSANKVQIK